MDENKLREIIGDVVRGEMARAREKAPSTYTPAADAGDNLPRPFKSLGEQMVAVARAGRAGGTVDTRLTELTRDASGLNETTPADGGYLVQPEYATELLKLTHDVGLLSARCRRVPMTSNVLKIRGIDEKSRANGSRWGGVQAYWESEAGTIQASRPKFRILTLELKKLTGLAYATDELIEDAAALESLIRDAFAEEFAFQIDGAIFGGSGDGEPLGILNSPALVQVDPDEGQGAGTVTATNIMNMRARLWARSRRTAAWLINQDVEPELHKLSLPVGTGGLPVFLPANGLSGQPFDTLYGMPIIPIEHASTLGDLGDIVLADLSQYLLAEKAGGIRSAVSIHVRFVEDELAFRFILRVDGKPSWAAPLTPKNGTTTLSPFVALKARS